MLLNGTEISMERLSSQQEAVFTDIKFRMSISMNIPVYNDWSGNESDRLVGLRMKIDDVKIHQNHINYVHPTHSYSIASSNHSSLNSLIFISFGLAMETCRILRILTVTSKLWYYRYSTCTTHTGKSNVERKSRPCQLVPSAFCHLSCQFDWITAQAKWHETHCHIAASEMAICRIDELTWHTFAFDSYVLCVQMNIVYSID